MAEFAPRGSLSKKFDQAAAPEDSVMYHAIPATPEGAFIRTSDKYGMKIPDNVVKGLSLKTHDANGEGGTPLVFASKHLSKAMTFAFLRNEGERMMNGTIDGTDTEFVILCDREKTMTRERDAKIFTFSGRDFMDLEAEKRQSVSAKPVAFKDTKVALHIKSADDMMRGGLQLLSFKNKIQDIEPIDQTMARNNWTMKQYLAEMVKSGELVWENKERGINPNPVLGRQLTEGMAKNTPTVAQRKI